jgi:hypothetical protein
MLADYRKGPRAADILAALLLSLREISFCNSFIAVSRLTHSNSMGLGVPSDPFGVELGVERLNFATQFQVPPSAQATRVNKVPSERLGPDSTYFCACMGMDPCSNVTATKTLLPPRNACSPWRNVGSVPQINWTVRFGDGCFLYFLRKEFERCDTKKFRFSAADYPATLSSQSGSASANSTPLSDLCPPSSLTFSKNLSNQIMSPKHLPEPVMLGRLENETEMRREIFHLVCLYQPKEEPMMKLLLPRRWPLRC